VGEDDELEDDEPEDDEPEDDEPEDMSKKNQKIVKATIIIPSKKKKTTLQEILKQTKEAHRKKK